MAPVQEHTAVVEKLKTAVVVDSKAAVVEAPKTQTIPSRFYRPELDVLRLLAFTMVFLDHALPVTGIFGEFHWLWCFRFAGGFGVCVFFMLSSFLITDLLEREHEITQTIQLRAFYIRRVLRIWPLYFSFLFFDFFVQQIRHTDSFPVGKLLAFLLLAGNWYICRFDVPLTLSSPLWSISVEEQFYLIWPPFRKYVGRTGAILLAVLTLAVSYIALAKLCYVHAQSIWQNSFVQFQFFSTGALLSFALRGRAPRLSTAARLAIFAVGAATLVVSVRLFFTHGANFTHLAPGFLLVNAGCIVMLLSFLGESRMGKWSALTYLGRISYGLYVFHWMMLAASVHTGRVLTSHHILSPLLAPWFTAITALLSSVVVASLSYRLFESPILRFKKRFEVIRTRPV
jgi:peptidoglycan/LPS O-acetylase OafA/YrhL